MTINHKHIYIHILYFNPCTNEYSLQADHCSLHEPKVRLVQPRFSLSVPHFSAIFTGGSSTLPKVCPIFLRVFPNFFLKRPPFNGPCTVPSGGARCSARADAPAPLRGRPRRRHTRSREDGPPKKPACRGNQWMDHGWTMDLLLIIRLMAIKCY